MWKHDQQTACKLNVELTWMIPILDYLEVLPENKEKGQKIKATSVRFTIIQGKLYRRSFSAPYSTCVEPSQVKNILSKLHEGECGNHSGARNLAHQIITT